MGTSLGFDVVVLNETSDSILLSVHVMINNLIVTEEGFDLGVFK